MELCTASVTTRGYFFPFRVFSTRYYRVLVHKTALYMPLTYGFMVCVYIRMVRSTMYQNTTTAYVVKSY